MRETIQLPSQTNSEFNVDMHSQWTSLKAFLRLAIDRFAPPVQRVVSAMGAVCVFMFISLWLVGPGTNAGAFDYARLLVPGIARQLLMADNPKAVSTSQEPEMAVKSIPSIAKAAAAIPASLVDSAALDRNVLKSERERNIIAQHLADKYHLTLSDSKAYVDQSLEVAREVNLDPILILAVMAVESSFDPNAQSRSGAQGLMQVRTMVHEEKFQPYGGKTAAFLPEANIRVGSLILKACIAKAGSLEAGLRSYLGAPNASSGMDSYTARVISEREQLRGVIRGTSNANV